jgi:hypothetical protein
MTEEPMSNDIYGYVLTQHLNEARARIQMATQEANLGVKFVTTEKLFNFPPKLLPSGAYVAFVLGDRSGKESADYLTDMVDYAPGALLGFPSRGEERLAILLDWVQGIAGDPVVESMFVAMCECSEIESYVQVALEECRQKLLDDFHQCAPPNRLYRISK